MSEPLTLEQHQRNIAKTGIERAINNLNDLLEVRESVLLLSWMTPDQILLIEEVYPQREIDLLAQVLKRI